MAKKIQQLEMQAVKTTAFNKVTQISSTATNTTNKSDSKIGEEFIKGVAKGSGSEMGKTITKNILGSIL